MVSCQQPNIAADRSVAVYIAMSHREVQRRAHPLDTRANL